jgi:hypothetical protein
MPAPAPGGHSGVEVMTRIATQQLIAMDQALAELASRRLIPAGRPASWPRWLASHPPPPRHHPVADRLASRRRARPALSRACACHRARRRRIGQPVGRRAIPCAVPKLRAMSDLLLYVRCVCLSRPVYVLMVRVFGWLVLLARDDAACRDVSPGGGACREMWLTCGPVLDWCRVVSAGDGCSGTCERAPSP